jgi:hypothetical protein
MLLQLIKLQANLTQADIGTVTDNLNTARESLQTNDTTAAFDAMNSVDSELFRLANDQGEQNMKALYSSSSLFKTVLIVLVMP